jgi:hypothetical protein
MGHPVASGVEALVYFQRRNGTSELVPFPFVMNTRVVPRLLEAVPLPNAFGFPKAE